MENLRLVYENENRKKVDITLPMKKWISDWWFDRDIVPSDDTVVLEAELDGKSIIKNVLAYIGTTKKGNFTFWEVAWYFEWNDLYDNYVADIASKESFEKSW